MCLYFKSNFKIFDEISFALLKTQKNQRSTEMFSKPLVWGISISLKTLFWKTQLINQ